MLGGNLMNWLFSSFGQILLAVGIVVVIMIVAIEAYYPGGVVVLLGGF